jgi:hypothetical protein
VEDLRNLYSYFDIDNNVKLQEKFFVDIMLYFGRRGRENLHEQKVSHFAASTDDKGCVTIFSTSCLDLVYLMFQSQLVNPSP